MHKHFRKRREFGQRVPYLNLFTHLAHLTLWLRPCVAVVIGGSICFSSVATNQLQLITLDPGHFHAALVQKTMYPQVSPVVHVYAPEGEDLQAHLKRINDFNHRSENPTHWIEEVYFKPDFLERLLHDKPGNVVVIAGNNTRKTDYIYRCVNAGLNVLGDKPMAINPRDFELLQKAFAAAAKHNVLLYDIMTERYEIATLLQGELARVPELFGTLQKGTLETPAVVMDSIHYFYKEVAGKPLIRPAWFFDVTQEGEAIPDVGSHLVDLVQVECFPAQALDWRKDVRVFNAKRWATKITPEQFKRATGLTAFPGFLKKDVGPDGVLNVFGNGEANYTVRNVHVKVIARWGFEPPKGAKDAHYSMLRGTRATLRIRQREQEKFIPTLYIEPAEKRNAAEFERAVRHAVQCLATTYPGLDVQPAVEGWQVVIPEKYAVGHEAHFAQVTEKFLSHLQKGKLPSWELPNMLAKYYTTTEAYKLSHRAEN
jgi:diadenosine tetraphosphate (Ap4A) HIT family hydrolase